MPCRRANKVREGRPHIVDMIKNDEISLIVNTTEGKQAIRESHSIRREAVARRVTYYTTLAGALATCEAHRPPAGSRGQPPPGSSQGSSDMRRKPLTLKGRRKAARRAAPAQDRGPAARHPGDRRGARARRPERERRVPRGARAAGLHRGPHQARSSTSCPTARSSTSRTCRRPAGSCSARPCDLEDQDGGAEVVFQIVGELEADVRLGPDLDHLADRARAGRQVGGRRGGRRGAGRRARLRDRRGALRLSGYRPAGSDLSPAAGSRLSGLRR